jgi:hypothetical protein
VGGCGGGDAVLLVLRTSRMREIGVAVAAGVSTAPWPLSPTLRLLAALTACVLAVRWAWRPPRPVMLVLGLIGAVAVIGPIVSFLALGRTQEFVAVAAGAVGLFGVRAVRDAMTLLALARRGLVAHVGMVPRRWLVSAQSAGQHRLPSVGPQQQVPGPLGTDRGNGLPHDSIRPPDSRDSGGLARLLRPLQMAPDLSVRQQARRDCADQPPGAGRARSAQLVPRSRGSRL